MTVTYQLTVLVTDDGEPTRLSRQAIVDLINDAECPAGVTVKVENIEPMIDKLNQRAP